MEMRINNLDGGWTVLIKKGERMKKLTQWIGVLLVVFLLTGCHNQYARMVLTQKGNVSELSFEQKESDVTNKEKSDMMCSEGYIHQTIAIDKLNRLDILFGRSEKNRESLEYDEGIFFVDKNNVCIGLDKDFIKSHDGWYKILPGESIFYQNEFTPLPFVKIEKPEDLKGLIIFSHEMNYSTNSYTNTKTTYYVSYIPICGLLKISDESWILKADRKGLITKPSYSGKTMKDVYEYLMK